MVFMFRLCGCAAGDSNLCGSQVGVDIRLVGEGSAEVGAGRSCRLTKSWFGNCLQFLISVSKELD